MRYLIAVALCLMMGVGFGQSPCNNQTSVTYQGYDYDIVEIGDQCWFAENLRATQYLNNDEIYYPETSEQWWSLQNQGAQCYHSNDIDLQNVYGNLYNWWAVTDERGICPNGWAPPSESDFVELIDFLGGEDLSAGKLKTTGTIEDGTGLWYAPNLNATNSSGFSAIPGAERQCSNIPGGDCYDNFSDIGYFGYFWSSTESQGGGVALAMSLYSYVNSNGLSWQGNNDGKSVRCVTNQLIVQIPGCTDPIASNYDPDATEDDGSCLYNGCMDSTSCNYNPDAIEDDGSCDYSCCPGPGCCNDGTYWDDVTQTCLLDITFCSWQPDSNADGNIGIGDLLDLLSVFGDTDYDEDGVFDSVDDCLDTAACNYQSNPSEPCAYIDVLGVCGGGCEGDGDDDGICDSEDDCVGVLDECGVCNGPGPTEIVIESITFEYDSVFLPLDDDWYVYEISTDTTFSYTCAPVFSACGDLIEHDGYDYSTVLIGEQCWFAENLRSTTYTNGDLIVTGIEGDDLVNADFGVVAVYGSSSLCDNYAVNINACDTVESLNLYGRLYNDHAVQDVRGLCPVNWHVPSEADWNALFSSAGGISVAGANLKANYGWENGSQYEYQGGGNGSNELGFSALPGGYSYSNEFNVSYSFVLAGNDGFWYDQTGSFVVKIAAELPYLQYVPFGNSDLIGSSACSIRCVRD